MFGNFYIKDGRRTVGTRRNMAASLLCVTAILLVANSVGTADPIPLPRERPVIVPGERSSTPETDIAPSLCQLRLSELAIFKGSPPITGPGQCMATDVVTVDALLLPDKHRVIFSPAGYTALPNGGGCGAMDN